MGLHRVGDAPAEVTWAQRFRSPAGVYGGRDAYIRARRALPLDSLEAKADTSALLGRVRLKDMLKPQEGLVLTIFGIPAVNKILGFDVEGKDD